MKVKLTRSIYFPSGTIIEATPLGNSVVTECGRILKPGTFRPHSEIAPLSIDPPTPPNDLLEILPDGSYPGEGPPAEVEAERTLGLEGSTVAMDPSFVPEDAPGVPGVPGVPVFIDELAELEEIVAADAKEDVARAHLDDLLQTSKDLD